MSQRDYYDILGVAKSASTDEIKAAHRKLARTYHPDVNKSPDAEQKFAEIQEAYDVLSDAKKRQLYDQFGHTGAAQGGGPGWSGGAGPGGFNVDVEDLGSMFETFFGSRTQPGGGFRAGQARPQSRPRPTPPAEIEVLLSFLTAARGGTERVRLTVGGKETSLEVKIPPAIDAGAKLRVRGVDGRDVLLRIAIGGHPLFRRGEGASLGKGLDLFLDLPLTIAEATFGATVTVPTLDGSVDLVVPPDSPSGRKLRIRSKGLTDQNGRQGDLLAILKVVPPDSGTLSQAERQTLSEIAGRTDLRSGADWPAGSKTSTPR